MAVAQSSLEDAARSAAASVPVAASSPGARRGCPQSMWPRHPGAQWQLGGKPR